MSLLAFDTDSTITTTALARAVAKGVAAVCVYVKHMTPALVQMISSNGLKVITVYETSATEAANGTAAGTRDGKAALTTVRACGQPDGSAIMATVDFDDPSKQTAVLAYLKAFAVAIEPMTMGVYGSGAICQAALDAKIARYTWVAGGSGMTGTKAFLASGRATMTQDVGDQVGLDLGISVDSDHILVADYGGWSTRPTIESTSAPIVSITLADAVATVRLLQTQLAALGLYHDEVDGQCGNDTRDAAMAAYNRSNS